MWCFLGGVRGVLMDCLLVCGFLATFHDSYVCVCRKQRACVHVASCEEQQQQSVIWLGFCSLFSWGPVVVPPVPGWKTKHRSRATRGWRAPSVCGLNRLRSFESMLPIYYYSSVYAPLPPHPLRLSCPGFIVALPFSPPAREFPPPLSSRRRAHAIFVGDTSWPDLSCPAVLCCP